MNNSITNFNSIDIYDLEEINGGWDMDKATVAKNIAFYTTVATAVGTAYKGGKEFCKGVKEGWNSYN